MKGGQRGDDLVAVGAVLIPAVLAGQLDRRLVGLGAAVAEKGPVGKGVAAEQFSQFNLLGYMIVVGAVDEFAGLFLQGSHHPWMTVPKVVDRNTGKEVEIALAVGVPQVTPFPPDRHQRITAVGFHDVFIRLGDPLC